MTDYQPLYDALSAAKADAWVSQLPPQISKAFTPRNHGNSANWQTAIAQIPTLLTTHKNLCADTVQIGLQTELAEPILQQLKEQLLSLRPWRKGPYDLFGIHIDTEWRSDWKWQRLIPHIAPLKHRLVLDVGCGNGYHCWRMLGEQAKLVVGIDPLLLNVMQFQAVKKLHGEAPVYVLPMGLEELPPSLKCFDTVFSMGVLYHRRSPIDHLMELRDCLQPGGELVLETLVIDGGPGQSLVPADRYAKMRNVWFIPSCDTLLNWLQRCGFINSRIVDVSVTTVAEQRSTDWMPFNSLKDFLDPNDSNLTSEGYPAPKRAIIIANAT
ncbi:MAG: tRNA 5-methoxyuridine(34)/uridine 5-oxyacetic acid(34) synthase CmoB [Methylococcales bacterium]